MCSCGVNSVTCIVCNNGGCTNVFVKGKQCYLYSQVLYKSCRGKSKSMQKGKGSFPFEI